VSGHAARTDDNVMYGAQAVPDARLIEPSDALVRVTRACIFGSDL
jgi:hypothetical protein